MMVPRAPFPYAGSKTRLATQINQRLGARADVYCEPFCGSLAVLLHRKPARREIVSDTSGLLVNLWRAMAAEPAEVAKWADWPTFHQDLTARQIWLARWSHENAARLSADAEYYDTRAAGWWCWGKCAWIGNAWCLATPGAGSIDCEDENCGDEVYDARPQAGSNFSHSGVSMQAGPIENRREYLVRWFESLQERLRRVITLNRDWTAAVTPTMLCDTPNERRLRRAVFLDPPYRKRGRHARLYESDVDGTSTETAEASYRWAIDHGDRYRIAYCAHDDDFALPERWTALTTKPSGNHRGETIMFSPTCESAAQGRLW